MLKLDFRGYLAAGVLAQTFLGLENVMSYEDSLGLDYVLSDSVFSDMVFIVVSVIVCARVGGFDSILALFLFRNALSRSESI